jgi:hypothetical protein
VVVVVVVAMAVAVVLLGSFCVVMTLIQCIHMYAGLNILTLLLN